MEVATGAVLAGPIAVREVPPSHAELRLPGQQGLDAAYLECERLARRTGRNFYWTFLVLPAPQRRAMCALYAFLRQTDDLADRDAPVAVRRADLEDWRLRLNQALTGDALGWWQALRDAVDAYRIPPSCLHAVIDGVTSDLSVSRYESFADLYRYCYRVASAVGLACIRVWGAADRAADLPAEWCGVGFQLTNIIRDLREDHAQGRIYLPQEDLRRFGVAEADLGRPPADPVAAARVRALLAFQLERAAGYYRRAAPLADHLPPAGRAVLHAMVSLYGGLRRRMEARPERVLSGRVSLHPARKLLLAARALPIRYFGAARQRNLPGPADSF